MARGILSEYGPEIKEGSRSTCGGVKEAKELPYSPPVGPKNKTDVGASGTNHGNAGTQGKR
jgi:hypothetical protein